MSQNPVDAYTKMQKETLSGRELEASVLARAGLMLKTATLTLSSGRISTGGSHSSNRFMRREARSCAQFLNKSSGGPSHYKIPENILD